jgi:hypothetical protein
MQCLPYRIVFTLCGYIFKLICTIIKESGMGIFNSASTRKKDLSISMVKANILAMTLIIPIIFLAGLYLVFWGVENSLGELRSLRLGINIFWIIIAVFPGVIVHELLHGFAWMYYAGMNTRQIKFGFKWKTLTPYAHCTEPMEVSAYRKGAAAPAVILGLIPYLIGLISGNLIITLYGLFFCFAAGGDVLILWLIRNVEKGKMVEDHPTQAGCYVID